MRTYCGGAGDDVLAISDTAFASLDGGTGTDTLRLDTAINLDLTSIANSRLEGIERIDLNGTGSTLTLNNDDVLSIVGTEAANDLLILGGNTCLLYTSPSPRDQRGSRMPSSA